MKPKPSGLDRRHAEPFGDAAVVVAYDKRPPYSERVDPLIVELAGGAEAHLLDLGCGTGELARRLAPHLRGITAIDRAERMIARARTLPGGDAPGLTWCVGRVEDVPLRGPFTAALAAESFHWFDWTVVAAQLAGCVPSRRLILVDRVEAQSPWTGPLSALIARFSTNRDYQPYVLVEELTTRRLFTVEGRLTDPALAFVQSIDDYVTSIHSRNGFSRDRMPAADAVAFDAAVREVVSPHATGGRVEIRSATRVVWGRVSAGADVPAEAADAPAR